jgi:hypothetical protein
MRTRGIFLVFLAGSLSAACTGGQPFLLQGDANSAQVGYSGNLDAAALVARRHCTQFERVPQFLEAEENIAFFDCVKP